MDGSVDGVVVILIEGVLVEGSVVDLREGLVDGSIVGLSVGLRVGSLDETVEGLIVVGLSEGFLVGLCDL